MNTLKRTVFIMATVMVSVLLGPVPLVFSQDNEQSRAALANLSGVHWELDVPRDLVSDDTRRQIITYVELRLKEADIKILPKSPEAPLLRIEIAIDKCPLDVPILKQGGKVSFPSAKYLEEIDVKLHQTVLLKRNTKVELRATTWEVNSRHCTRPLSWSEGALKNKVKDLVDKFIASYLAANPK